MTKYKPPQTLVSLSSQVFANLALNQIRLLEINPQYNNDNFNEAQDYFNSLPSMIVHQILGKSVESYVNDCKRYSNGDLVSMIQYGQVCDNVFSIQEKCVLPNLIIPRLSSIYAFQVSSNVTHLDFTYLIHLGTLSTGTFGNFHRILAECLSRLPALQYLNLKSPNSRTCLPSLTGEHLKILGQSCVKLNYLDISFHTGLKPEELLHLTPDIDPAGRKGCPDLETLHIFDCGFSDKCVKVIAVKLKNLKELGYKEMGSVIKKIYKENFGLNLSTELKITHINHLGGKIRKTSVSSLRCKKNIIDAIHSVCTKVTNLKARVQDADMENLVVLKHLNSVELLFNVGRPTSPALGAATFFQVLGPNLTSVALICSAISMVHIQMLGKNCPNLASLWLRSNYFQVAKGSRDELPDDMTANHSGFRNLRTLYFRVGEGELALTFVPTYVLGYILRNAVDLTELKIALRSYIVSDDYICGLLIDCCLYKLEKLLIVVPGVNNLSGVIKLTMRTVEFVIDFCTGIKSIGNVYSWDILTHPESEFVKLKKKINDEHLELNLINRHMVMH